MSSDCLLGCCMCMTESGEAVSMTTLTWCVQVWHAVACQVPKRLQYKQAELHSRVSLPAVVLKASTACLAASAVYRSVVVSQRQ